jgi:hypothetical protein
MAKIYVAFYDDKDGGSRENWNTFYTPWVASTTRAGAERLAKEAIKKMTLETIYDDYEVDLNTTTIDEIEDEELREEVREEYDYYMDRYIVEIQEGELE